MSSGAPSILLSGQQSSAGDSVPSLFSALFHDPEGLYKSHDAPCYYAHFVDLLQHSFRKAPREYKLVGGSQCQQNPISSDDLQSIATATCQQLSVQQTVNLTELASSLVTAELATADEAKLSTIEQLSFAIFGWTSMLFVPSSRFVEGKLVIQVHQPGLVSSPSSSRFDTWVRSEQDLSRITGSLRDILRDFSNDGRGPLWCIGDATSELPQVDMLSSSNVNFFTLAKLAGLRIKWVDSVCMHLELNRRDKTLLLFQHPSVCALMCLAGDRGMYLDHFFRHYFSVAGETSSLPPDLLASPAASFYKEVLLTYRLIFGQHKRSWRLCSSEGGVEIPGQKKTFWQSCKTLFMRRSKNAIATRLRSLSRLPADDLLPRLCCADSAHEVLYDYIGAPDVRSIYSAQQDFPFFGDRLIALQEYVRLLEPTDLRTLYYDRRDLGKFFTVWTTMVIGVVTLSLTTLGVLLAAGQIATTFKPN